MDIRVFLNKLLRRKTQAIVICGACGGELPWDALSIPVWCGSCGRQSMPIRWGEGE